MPHREEDTSRVCAPDVVEEVVGMSPIGMLPPLIFPLPNTTPALLKVMWTAPKRSMAVCTNVST